MSAVMRPAEGGRAQFEAARERLRARWRALGLRERRAIGIAATVIAVFALWSLLIQPALRVASTAPQQLDRLESQLQQMRRQAAEARELRGAPVVGLAQSAAALQSATGRLADKAKLQVLGDRATITFTNASGEQIRRWLAEARAGGRARPVEATLTRTAQGYSGTIIVSLPSGSSS